MPPYILLSVVLGAIYGVLFHLWRGKSVQDLVIYIIAGVLGFVLGQILVTIAGFRFLMIGPLHIVEATLVSWGALFAAQWLKI